MTCAEEVGVALVVTAIELVVTGAAVKGVVTGTTFKGVVALLAIKHIVAIATTEAVVAGTTVENVVATVTAQAIVTRTAVNDVGGIPTSQAVIAVCAVQGEYPGGQVCRTNGAVVELEVVAAVAVAVEVILDRNLIFAAVSLDVEVPAVAVKDSILCFCPVEAQGIGLLVFAGVIVDNVFAMTRAEEVGVALVVTAIEPVVAGTTVENVVATVTVQGIVTRTTGKIVGTLIAAQAVVAVAANAVSQGFQVLFAEDVGVLGEGAVLLRFGGKLHELLGQRCHCDVFTVGVAFSEQFAEIGEGFAGIFCVYFVEEGGNAAVVQLQFAFFVHAEADGVEVGFEAGLEEQAVVEIVGEVDVGFFDGVNDMLRL